MSFAIGTNNQAFLALLKLHLTDRITIENKVIERLVKPVDELILTPQR
jgi:hypothetical protein